MKPSFRQLPWILALAACAAPSAPPAQARTPPVNVAPELAARLESLANDVERGRNSLHLPGLALAIVQDDRLIFARGFGLADVEHGTPVTAETIFAIGSASKAFTATLIAQLTDEGKLTFDDPVTKALPWFVLPIQEQTNEHGPVSLRDLLSHRTGFSHMDVLWYGGQANAEQVLRTAVGAEPIAPFRAQFHYNNVMFLAAGEACAAVAGESWETLVRERFLEPLGMRDTTTSVRAAQRDPRLALGYAWSEEQQHFERLPMRDLSAIAPAGALNSNVLDLSRWARFQLGRGEFEGQRLVSAASLDETWKTHNPVAPGVSYGLAWFLRDWNGERMVEHGGNIDGFAAEVALLPGRRTGVVLLANVSATPLQGTIGPLVFEALYGAPKTAAEPTAATTEDLPRFTGTYLANFFQFKEAKFDVRAHDGKLWVNIPGQSDFELAPPDAQGKRPFALLPEQIQVSFAEGDESEDEYQAGRIVALTLYQNGFAFECLREGYEPLPDGAPVVFEPYLGSFADPLAKKTMTLVLQHGRLAVDYPEQMVYELFPPDADGRWVFRSNPVFAVEFQLDADGRAEALTFHERGTQRECERVDEAGQALPTLAELLRLRRGSEFEARLAELGPCRLRWTLRLVNSGITGTNTVLFDARGRFRDETDLAPFALSATHSDGVRVIAESSLEKTLELVGANKDASLAGATLAFYGDWSKHFDQLAVLKAFEEGGKSLAVVKLKKGAAPTFLVTLDRVTGDLVSAEIMELVDGVGALPKSLTFEDWREVEGLRLPGRIVSEDDGTGRAVADFVALDVGVDGGALERLPALPGGG